MCELVLKRDQSHSCKPSSSSCNSEKWHLSCSLGSLWLLVTRCSEAELLFWLGLHIKKWTKSPVCRQNCWCNRNVFLRFYFISPVWREGGGKEEVSELLWISDSVHVQDKMWLFICSGCAAAALTQMKRSYVWWSYCSPVYKWKFYNG